MFFVLLMPLFYGRLEIYMSNYTVKTQKGVDIIRDYSDMSELKVYVGECEIRVFLQKGFFEHDATPTNLHNHRYCEIQVAFDGEMNFNVGGKNIKVSKGQGIIIPVDEYHSRFSDCPEGTKMCAFQVGMDVSECEVVYLDGVSELLYREIEYCSKHGGSARLSSVLGLICSYFYKGKVITPTPLYDREFIIYEFFANNYDKDVSLSDIAIQLRLSEKQAERLIIKCTGNSFRRQIVAKRIENAKMLVKNEGISLAKAAERVGYKSYSGFWKALQSYETEESN